jgi:Zinc knuckle
VNNGSRDRKDKDKKSADDKSKLGSSGNSSSKDDRPPPIYKAYSLDGKVAGELRKLGKCYKCKEPGHLASDCTVKLAPIELSAEKNDNSENA